MEIIIDRACGLDVHKETAVGCVIGDGIGKEIRTFGTMTEDLLQLAEWLKGKGVTHVAMESTGVYWRPIYNVLESDFEVMLVNARHVKHVPGRKTDVSDCEWLCKLLRCGLLKESFVPEADMRELRDLSRYRKKLVHAQAAEKNRVQKVLEDAGIKLSSVVSDTFGVSASAIVEELMKGELTVEEMSALARGRLKAKREQLKKALVGHFKEHHKFMLTASLKHIREIEKIVADIDARIDQKMKPYQAEYELLQTIPGVKEVAAASIIAEIGTDMSRFPDEEHLSSWAGMSPGLNESAGKKKACKVTHGNKALKVVLVECAWAASKTKDTYLKGKYNSLVGRRGKKKALLAVGHKILIACYHILKKKEAYRELGASYLDKRKAEKIVRSHVKRLSSLGYEVTLKAKTA